MGARTREFRRRVVAWLALVAMLGHFAPPVAAAGHAQAHGADTIQLCTAYGFRTVSVPASDLPPDGPLPARDQHCSHCCCAVAVTPRIGAGVPTCEATGRLRAAAPAALLVTTGIFIIPDARGPPRSAGT
jgi:hypothetical protein